MKFNIKNFWEKKLNFTKIKNIKKYFSSINKYFSDEQLKKGFQQPPYFYYPLSHWLFYSDKCPIYKKSLCLLDTQLFTFEKYKIKGFDNRIKKLQNDCSQESFYSFLSELGLAWHFLYYRHFRVEFFDFINSANSNRKPDLKIKDPLRNKDLFIEVYTSFKFYFRIIKLEELLKEIDSRLKISRDLFLQSPPSKLDGNKINNIINTIFKKLSSNEIKNKMKTDYQIILWQEGNLQIYLELDDNFENGANYNSTLIKNSGGEPLDTYRIQLKEIFKDKGLYSQLENFHPNILAINSLFNEDFQLGISLRLEHNPKLDNLAMPECVDTFYLFALGIDSELIDFKKQGKLFWRENSDLNIIKQMTLTF